MARILVDANMLLDFYRMKRIRPLLASLVAAQPDVFISKQVRCEVIRNRLKVAAESLAQDAKQVAITVFDLPDVLTEAAVAEIDPEMSTRIRSLTASGAELRKDLQVIEQRTLMQVAQGTDPVSQGLTPLLDGAVAETAEDLSLARARRELGNPPGKPTSDPLGDQLTWEMFLRQLPADAEQVWIASKDSDYIASYAKKPFLNPLLWEDLRRGRADRKVYPFQKLFEALEHYSANAVGAVPVPTLTPEDGEVVRAAEEQLSIAKPPLCKCPSGPTPTGWLAVGSRWVVLCQVCRQLLAVQHNDEWGD